MAAEGEQSGVPMDARVVRTRNDILGTALKLLHEEGWEAVTHAQLAEAAGYSKATIYKHWPQRADLLRDAFQHLEDLPHHEPVGDLRTDLIGELVCFRDLMRNQALDRGAAILVDLAMVHPELAAVRDELVLDGEHVLRELLGTRLEGVALDAGVLMLSGSVVASALMHGQIPDDDVIVAAVDLLLGGLPD